MNRSRATLAAFFNLTGILHFVIPRSYEAMVPEPVPAKEAVAVSGVAEILGGLALLHPRTRHLGRWWLLALLFAVFPANVHMAVNPEQIRGLDLNKVPRWLLWARLPLQPLAMLWVWRATRPTSKSPARAGILRADRLPGRAGFPHRPAPSWRR